MTDKEKLIKLKKLADSMYYAAQYLTTDASRLHKAMDEYHKFIVHECKEEPVSEPQVKESLISTHDDKTCKENGNSLTQEPTIPDIVDEHFYEMLGLEPVSNPIDFEQELYKAFGQVKDFTLGMQIAKWFYDMGRNYQEPVSEELEKAAKEWLNEALNKSGEGLDEWIMNIEGVPSEEIWLGIRNISEARQNIRSVINDINISLDIIKNIKEQ